LAAGAGGLESNPVPHLLIVKEGLFTPKTLDCPADTSKEAARDFQTLRPSNVTYQFRFDTNNPGNNPGIVAYCPIHGHALLTDGSVRLGNKFQTK
jgi:hypothetical protein